MTHWRWAGVLSIVLLGAGWIAPGSAHAGTDGYTLEDLKLDSAGDLMDVCTIDPTHEHYTAGLAFCYGFFEGAIRYDQAISGTDNYVDLVCSPDGTTRLQAVEVFVNYMSENQQYSDERPVDVIFRALIASWPCTE
ncbi:MAG: Rap1a/Tai family immunity protein [Xanthomonadales bacterium]|nr:Rap1a/Tai family immunity protein [Xanthomonadales bacterium]